MTGAHRGPGADRDGEDPTGAATGAADAERPPVIGGDAGPGHPGDTGSGAAGSGAAGSGAAKAAASDASPTGTATGGIEAEAVEAGYGRIEVLHGVSLAARPGEIVAVVGANGAGKTTLLRALSGLLPPTAGRIRLGGRDVTGRGPEAIAAAGLAHVPENRLVFPTLAVADNLALGGWTRRRDKAGLRARRDQVLEYFPRLADRLGQAAGTLSGGEQQMLSIGRGLMARPAVLVLDEPSLGLAPRVVREIFATLGRLRAEEGLAIVLVEQNVRAAFRVADRATVMDRGRVLLDGAPADLLDDVRVQHAYLGGGYTLTPDT
ncbi:MAG TPA: ABC transporter ATP-binding protein [Pseudonocardia sp.]|nr:ABC transporter ATP-binding protein [Pseudonocardia sp.]